MCAPGYYLQDVALTSGTVQQCVQRIETTIKQDLFVFSSNEDVWLDSSGEDGTTFDTAYSFLGLALHDAYQGVS